MKIVGVDASSNKSGVAVFDDGKYIEHTLIDLHTIKDINKRIPMMIDGICKYIHKFKPDKIIMEETVMTSNASTLKKLSYLAGGVMFYAYRHGIEFELTIPSAWRKKCGLEQSSKVQREVLKLESMQAVKIAYGLDVTDDESDAILICRSGFDLPKIDIKADDVDMSLAIMLD